TRQGEIDIAKRIEEGIKHVLAALGRYPEVVASILDQYALTETGQKRLGDIITGFIDDDVPIEAIVAMPDEAELDILAEEIEEPLPETKSDDKITEKVETVT